MKNQITENGGNKKKKSRTSFKILLQNDKNTFISQIVILIFISGALGGMFFATDIYGEVQDVIVETLCLSCIKLEYKLNQEYTFQTANGGTHPDFILENLSNNIVFLHYSGDACHGCEIMFPIIKEFFNIEFEKEDFHSEKITFEESNISYIYIYKDTATKKMRDSYKVYDIQGDGGIPMFTAITLNYNRGFAEPYYVSIYGTLDPNDDENRIQILTDLLKESIKLHEDHIESYNP